MRTYFLLLAGLILLAFTACQNDELVNGGSGNETAVSFSVQWCLWRVIKLRPST